MTGFHLQTSAEDSSEITLGFSTVFYALILPHCILTVATYVYTCACTHTELAVPAVSGSGSVWGGVVLLFSLRGCVGEEGLI